MSFKEKRQAPRLKILETFSIFVSVPKKGPVRLTVHEVSLSGLSMNLDLEGESVDDFPLKVGEKIQIDFFLNNTLSIPITMEVMRIDDRDGVRSIGGKFVESESSALPALQSFVKLLDELANSQGIVLHT